MISYDEWMRVNGDKLDPNKQYRQVYVKGEYFPYIAVDDGTVISMQTGRFVKPNYNLGDGKNTDKYGRMKLYKNGREISATVHRLIWSSFTKDDNVKELDHLDFDPKNNALSNLRPTTHSENIKRSVDIGNIKPPRKNDIETQNKVIQTCELLAKGGLSFIEIAEIVGFTEEYVKDIYNRKVRTSISDNYKWASKRDLMITREQAVIICNLLESPKQHTVDEIASIVGTTPHFVNLVKSGIIHKDLTINRRFSPMNMSDIPLLEDERIAKATYMGHPLNKYITDTGRVFEFDGTESNTYVNNDGFLAVSAKYTDTGKKEPISIFKMVADTFVDNPNGYEYIGFRDLDPTNIRYDNLIWMTESERRGMKSKKPDKALTLDKAHKACKLIAAGLSDVDIAEQTQLTRYMVTSIRNKNIIRWISDQYFDDGVERISKSGKRMKGNKRFTESDILDMLNMYNHGIKPSKIAKKYDTSKEQVNNIVRGRQHADIKAKFDKTKNLVILCGREPHARKINW